ncbi:hypothetical protein BT69DRAFT_1318474 [Atractiella rhizophila]|nr:hypothetical protein BT69DRAFT_1318474 [Atractiella rhizophila]
MPTTRSSSTSLPAKTSTTGVTKKRKAPVPVSEGSTASKRQKLSKVAETNAPSLPSFPTASQLSEAVSKYGEAVALKSQLKEKGGSKGKRKGGINAEVTTLIELEAAMEELYSVLNDSDEEKRKDNLTKEDLERILTWKLTREKSRPFLPKLVKSNSPKEIEEITKSAITTLRASKTLTEAYKGLDEVCKLKGVGPATGSAVLSLIAPHRLPFYSDEAASFFGDVKYTVAAYKRYAEGMAEKVEGLGEQWDGRKLEKALWSVKTLDINTQEEGRQDA